MSLVDVLPEVAALLVAAGAEEVVLETLAGTDVVAALVVEALVVEALVVEALVDTVAEDEDAAGWVAFEDDVEVVA